jgi:dynein intermediate chain 2
MEVISYTYERPRRQFGTRPSFQDVVQEVESVVPDSNDRKMWRERVTNTIELDCIPAQSLHSVNTERFVQVQKGVNHTDGAWPAEVKSQEYQDKQRFLRRITNEETYHESVVSLVRSADSVIQQNSTIDLYEMYFDDVDEGAIEDAEPPSCKTLCVLRDPNQIRRSATCISWHPENAHKLAVAYSIQQFQQIPDKMSTSSYIWDVTSPNEPEQEITPPSPLCSLSFNPRTADHLIGGCYHGQLAFFDLRKGPAPVEVSGAEFSHYDPVYDVAWIQSRTGSECVSISTDGQLLWWDIRKIDKGPMDRMLLQNILAPGALASGNVSAAAAVQAAQAAQAAANPLTGPAEVVYGATRLEYNSDAGATRYLVGTEQGQVLLCDRKAKKDKASDKVIKSVYGEKGGGHYGPIYSIQRNPHQNMLKYFLTVGDWTVRVWNEDCRTPILTTPFDRSSITAACWSPSRSGVFFSAKSDGSLDAWDLFYRHNAPAFSTRVSDTGLCSIKLQQSGALAAVGDLSGTVTVLDLNSALSQMQKTEKKEMVEMFERETRREKNVEMRQIARKREIAERRNLANQEKAYAVDDEDDEDMLQQLKKAEEEFYFELENHAGNALLSGEHGEGEEEEEVKKPDAE